MLKRLTKGLDEQTTKDVRASFAGSAVLRRHLARVMEEDIDAILSSMLSQDPHEANWALDQAARVAKVKAKKDLIALIK